MTHRDGIDALVAVVDTLRAPGGCPWDREQTWQSLMPYIVEEAYELKEAMAAENPDMLREELGDVLLHVVMLSAMAAEKNWFSLGDVAKEVTDKMIRRHPHVFGNTEAKNSETVLKNWDAIKKEEKKQKRFGTDIPAGLPSLMSAQKLQSKAARMGFDWPDVMGALVKLKEEIGEVEQALTTENKDHLAEELGDVLFSAVNVCRKAKLDAEMVLEASNRKFMRRVQAMMHADNGATQETPMEIADWEKRWEKVKAEE
jgi:tetrapyrrole methylase family protein / MazG family protein